MNFIEDKTRFASPSEPITEKELKDEKICIQNKFRFRTHLSLFCMNTFKEDASKIFKEILGYSEKSCHSI